MSTTELIEYISGTTSASVRPTLAAWMDYNDAFRLFVERYRDKIRRKMRVAEDDDDLSDLLWELEVAYLLLKNVDLTIEYEPCGADRLRSPDYRVSLLGGRPFYVEARRIRQGPAEIRFRAWEREMEATISSFPSDLGVALRIVSANPRPELLEELEGQGELIKESIRQALARANTELHPGQLRSIQLGGFEGLISLDVSMPRSKADLGQTSYYGCSRPIWYTQQEFKKFGDIICEKLGQLRAGMANVLAIGSVSETHEDFDCDAAIEELRKLAASSNDSFFWNKGFAGASDFLSQFRYLSGVVFRSSWRRANISGRENARCNFVWRNSLAAQPLDDRITEFFSEMN